jgi:hypothetical protein
MFVLSRQHLQIESFIRDQAVVRGLLTNNTTMMITVAFHPSPAFAGRVAVRR